jgi:uncharacterized protein with ParB-like and HNH nuclease domain
MDKIVKLKAASLLCLITGAVIGFLTGTAGLSLLVSYRIEKYHQEIERLESEVYEKDLRLAKLEESINKNKFLLKDIQVFMLYEGEADELSLEKAIKGKYKKLLGKEIKTLDGDIIADIIDDSVIKVGKREYLLRVVKLVISEIMKVWVEVKELG